MERKKSEQLTDVVHRFLRESGLESPLAEYRLLQAWSTVVGRTVASQTQALYVRHQTLIVRASSPALRIHLLMRRSQLVHELNAAAGANVITDIAFY